MLISLLLVSANNRRYRGGNVTFWYVSAAFAFYLLSFPLFHMLKKYPLPFTALISIVGILLFYLGILWMNDTLGNIHLFLARIPIYFSGLFVGYKIKVLHFPSKILVLISLLAYLSLGMGSMLLGGRVFTLYGFNFALLFFVTPGLIVALTIAFRWMEQWKMGKLFNKLLQYIGTFSLELYFTHMLIINLICQNHMEMNFGIFLMLSIVSSVVLKKMASCFLIMVKSFLIE